MNGFALLLATALWGVDYGWQPASDGRLEYIIQIEPVTLFALRDGKEVDSQVDPFVRDVRRFRIRVGTDVVPRLGTPVPETAAAFSAAASAPPPGVSYGWQPASSQQVDFLVQIAPERLATLQKDPIVGEIPFELNNVARVRIRSGTGPLPRQNLPPAATPVAPVGPNNAPAPQGTRPGNPAVAGTISPGASTLANGAGAASSANPAGGWPPGNRQGMGGQPSRYDPPANVPTIGSAVPSPTNPAIEPAGDPRSNYASNANTSSSYAAPPSAAGPLQSPAGAWPSAPGQNSNWQPQDTSWQNAVNQNPSWTAPQQPSASGQAPMPTAVNQPPPYAAAAPAPPGQPGLTDPGGFRPWDSGPAAAAGSYSGNQPSAVTSSPWGVPDDRYTTERGEPLANHPAASTSSSGWGPLVSLPQPPGQPTAATSPSSSWTPTPPGSQAVGPMASPFADPVMVADRPTSLESSVQPPWEAGGGSVQEAGFFGDSKPKKVPDFWADLAQAADDPSLGFLREENSSSPADKPWWPLTLAMLALFASMGGNLYMGWIAVDVYRRYLDMADDSYDDDSRGSPRDRDESREWSDRPRRRERAGVED